MAIESGHLRYAAHLPLAAIGAQGQDQIGAAHVALIGVGGLGCAAAQYLVASGVGTLTICDFDTVAESNLSRQVLFSHCDLGRAKAVVAAETLQALNPDTKVNVCEERMADSTMGALFPDCDFVIDASDNYGTRLAVNRATLAARVPWVMASCIRLEGQLMLLRPDLPEQPCYRCAYGEAPEILEDCPGAGIFAPVAGIAGAGAAHFALATLAGSPPPQGLHLFDAQSWSWQSLKFKRNPDCKDCD